MRLQYTIQLTDGELRVSSGSEPARQFLYLTGQLPETSQPAQFARVTITRDDATIPPTELPGLIMQTVRRLTPKAVEATLIIPSSWCYIQRIELPQRRPKRTMLEYALEEYLPVEIESLTCEFLKCGPNAWIGVALETARLQPILKQLQAAGIHIERITLDVLEVASWLEASHVVWVDRSHQAELESTNACPSTLRITRWNTSLSQTEAQPSIDDPSPVRSKPVICGATPECASSRVANAIDRDSSMPGIRRNPIRALKEFSLARGNLAPTRRNARRLQAVAAAALAASVILLFIAGAQSLRRAQFNLRLAQINAWEQSLFQKVFPDEPVPAGVALRVSSERRRLQGLTHVTNNRGGSAANAIDCLRDLVAALPGDLRLNLQEVRIDGSDVTVRGIARDPGQAERLTQSLTSSRNLQADAPRTDRARESGVQFFAHAKRISESTKQGAKR